jgi:hypothetical protein
MRLTEYKLWKNPRKARNLEMTQREKKRICILERCKKERVLVSESPSIAREKKDERLTFVDLVGHDNIFGTS